MKSHTKVRTDEGVSTCHEALARTVPKKKIRSMCLGVEDNPQRLKYRMKVPPFEGMLSPEKRRALATIEVVPKDRKGLGYRRHDLHPVVKCFLEATRR